MSFQDLKNGAKQTPSSSSSQSQAVAAAIFEINGSVAAYRRLVDALGTYQHTPHLRLNLQNTRQRILQLVKNTSAHLKSLSHSDVTASKKMEDAKLARDLESALHEFQSLQRRESAYTTSSSSLPSTSGSASTPGVDYSGAEQSRLPLLMEHKRQEELMADNEIAFNEAIIDEREEGIKDIQEQIGETTQIFKDLAVLVHDQGALIDDIHSNVDDSSVATTQTRVQLAKASKSVKSRCSMCLWVVLVMFVAALVIFLVVLILR